jgi:PEP-CTERM motif
LKDDMMTGIGKMMLRAGALALAIGMASSANAAQVLITYRGIVSSGSDIDGVFGSVRSLTGLAFTAAYTLNDPSPGVFQTNDGITDFRAGGPQFGGTGPMLSASLTVDGIPLDLGPAYYSSAELIRSSSLSDGATDEFTGITQPFSSATRLNSLHLEIGNRDGIIRGANAQFLNLLSYANPVNYSPVAGINADGFFFFSTNFGNVSLTNAFGQLQVTSFSIGPVPVINAVPEPASWAMMIFGFGLVGGAMRSKRRSLGQLRAIA